MGLKSLVVSIVASVIALFAATLLVPNVSIDGAGMVFWRNLFWAGLALGLLNFFLKPILKVITFPLHFLTFGLIGIVINILLVWIVDILFIAVHIIGLWPLALTGVLSWAINHFFQFLTHRKDK